VPFADLVRVFTSAPWRRVFCFDAGGVLRAHGGPLDLDAGHLRRATRGLSAADTRALRAWLLAERGLEVSPSWLALAVYAAARRSAAA